MYMTQPKKNWTEELADLLEQIAEASASPEDMGLDEDILDRLGHPQNEEGRVHVFKIDAGRLNESFLQDLRSLKDKIPPEERGEIEQLLEIIQAILPNAEPAQEDLIHIPEKLQPRSMNAEARVLWNNQSQIDGTIPAKRTLH